MARLTILLIALVAALANAFVPASTPLSRSGKFYLHNLPIIFNFIWPYCGVGQLEKIEGCLTSVKLMVIDNERVLYLFIQSLVCLLGMIFI